MTPTNTNPPASAPRTYQIRIQGELDADYLAAYCPPGAALQVESGSTLITHICADQSGLLGLLRGLHNLGCTILSITSQEERG